MPKVVFVPDRDKYSYGVVATGYNRIASHGLYKPTIRTIFGICGQQIPRTMEYLFGQS